MKRAFTLIELMVVISILGIILSIAIPTLLRKKPINNSPTPVARETGPEDRPEQLEAVEQNTKSVENNSRFSAKRYSIPSWGNVSVFVDNENNKEYLAVITSTGVGIIELKK